MQTPRTQGTQEHQKKATYCLLQPKVMDADSEYMQPGEVLALFKQGRWITAVLISKSVKCQVDEWQHSCQAQGSAQQAGTGDSREEGVGRMA